MKHKKNIKNSSFFKKIFQDRKKRKTKKENLSEKEIYRELRNCKKHLQKSTCFDKETIFNMKIYQMNVENPRERVMCSVDFPYQHYYLSAISCLYDGRAANANIFE